MKSREFMDFGFVAVWSGKADLSAKSRLLSISLLTDSLLGMKNKLSLRLSKHEPEAPADFANKGRG